jgi:hypothetical protein
MKMSNESMSINLSTWTKLLEISLIFVHYTKYYLCE